MSKSKYLIALSPTGPLGVLLEFETAEERGEFLSLISTMTKTKSMIRLLESKTNKREDCREEGEE